MWGRLDSRSVRFFRGAGRFFVYRFSFFCIFLGFGLVCYFFVVEVEYGFMRFVDILGILVFVVY